MDEIRRPRPVPARSQGRFKAPERPSEKPALVWNPVIRQWWTPPAVEAQETQRAEVTRPETPAVLPPKTPSKAPRPKKARRKTVTIDLHFPLRVTKKDIIRALIYGPPQPKNRLGRKAYNSLRIAQWPRFSFSLTSLVLVFVLLIEVVAPMLDQRWQTQAYALSDGDKSVIAEPSDEMAQHLQHDLKTGDYTFNADFSPTATATNHVVAGDPQIKATLNDDLSKGVTATDPYTETDFTVTPKFQALSGRQSKNQVSYPFRGGTASLVYSLQAGGIKEDILLHKATNNNLKFIYKLGLGDQYVARLSPNGTLNIYGSSLPLGNVNTSSAKDDALLQKARKKAVKDKLLFSLPPPVIHEAGNHLSKAAATYRLNGDELTVVATNLKSANYPLSIDPTVQISTISEFYRNTSVESNADFDVSNNQITRGAISGGTTGTWTATTTMNQARFLNGAATYNGYVYVVGGANTTSTTNLAGSNANMVEYASISTATPAVFGSWTAGNNSGLPAGGLSRFQLIAYKGFIYAIGGSGTNTTCANGNLSTTVYYAPVQVNGVLGAWTTTNAPSTARCSFGATAYNGKIYIAGGKTGNAAGNGTTDVSYATVNPNGTLTWTNNVSVTLPAARYGNDLQAYNGYLYVVGGSLNGTLTNTVLYAALNTDGSLYGSASTNWSSTNNFTTARENFGTLFSSIHNGYMYLAGGCKAVNASQTCNTSGDVMSDTQLAQVNADGSLGQWAATTSLVAARAGAPLVFWRGTVYNIGGCAAMNAANIYCTTTLATTQYGAISTAGQASVLKTSANTLTTAVFGAATAVLNGYIYVVGGCTTNDCQSGSPSVSNQTYYATINNDGTLGSWQNSATNTINGTGSTSGIAETALVAANGSLYAFGGYNDSAPTRSVYVVTPSASTGALPGAWTAYTNVLPATAYAASAMYFNGNFIIFGGCIAANGTFGCSTYRQTVSKVTFNGTTWSGVTALTAIPTSANYPNAAMGFAYYDGYVYLCGGAAAAQGQTQYCAYNKLSNTATLGSWALATGLLNVGTSPDHPIRRNSAYASNGFLYVYAGHDGANNSSVGTINIGAIDPSTGNIGSDFTISTTAFTPKWDSASAFANGNIYTIGGCTTGAPPTSCTARSNATEYFQIYNATNSGTRNVVSTAALGTAAIGVAATVAGGYLYFGGGCTTYTVSTTNCGATTTTTQYAAINPDGSLGTYGSGPALTQARGFGCMAALNGTLYYIGGSNTGAPVVDVYYSTINGASMSAWGAATSLPVARIGHSCATYNNRIYVTGGQTTSTVTTVTNITYYSSSLPNGGGTITWNTASNAFTTARSYHATVAVAGYLWVMGGGTSSTAYLSDVQSAQINISTGDLAAWSYTHDLPYKMRQMAAYAANGYIYVVGGANGTGTTCLNSTYVANITTNGNVGYWQQGAATTNFTARSGAGLGYNNGYYYIIGGNDCTNNLTTNYSGGEQSQAIRSIFTRYIDLVGDAHPWNIIINGTNASVNSLDLEKWRFSYNSSRIATNSFGATTVLTPIPFGSTVTAMNAIDGSSVNQGVSRYWSFTFDIDQTQSFAFVDGTPPAIISYSFYYAPSGNTRLRNGRIFQDQTKQALDAHP